MPLIMFNYVLVNLGLLFKNILYGSQGLHSQCYIPNNLMLQTKHNLPFGSREEHLNGYYNIYGHGAHFGQVTTLKFSAIIY